MPQVFISYKHNAEVDLFDLLVMQLEKADYQVWTDKKLSPGESWTRSIDQAIKDSFALIVIMTKAAHESEYVTYEWSYAYGAGKRVITMLVDEEVKLHPRLTDIQYCDFTNNKRPWESVVNSLREIQRQLRETQQEQAFRWMQDGDAELAEDDQANALDSYSTAYSLADDRLRVRIGYKMAKLYIRQIERSDDNDKKAELIDKAETLLVSALNIRSNYHAARAYLGYIYRLKRDVVVGNDKRLATLEQARTAFKEALNAQPDLIDYRGESWWGVYGGVLKRLGDIIQPNDAEAAARYYDQAIDAYQKATGYGRKSSYPYNNLALLYLIKGDKQQMVANYDRVQYYPPNDAGDYYGHADQLVANLIEQDRAGSEAELKQYLAFAPKNARKGLLETLRPIVGILDHNEAALTNEFIDRLTATID